ncbi:ImmA/IrrE family metallo-endopeptidase [Vagococcus carniphilus]|uniref:ImmA/IrrE family metallo-endopeptidase n=1 Tax=Vagococcus carniphilus TaxID=218144 RepID=UPI00289182D8|nr:ImmA/IrrE family metallo-endopeptidase [Vagococcus carniphilus]MDT2849027.1 ImmA/IrrE family metallo-endopeptidase [Vagococcus carniphilus]
MLGMDLNVNNYDRQFIWDEVISKGVNIRPFPFEKTARRSISGMIVKDSYEVTLAYNSNMSSKRKNFTISHELIHFLFHLDDNNHMFTDTKESPSYSYVDLLPEFQANIGAAVLLLPEPVLIREFKNGSTPYLISEKYGISEAALFMRLTQLMQGNFEASYMAASKTANKIMSGNSKRTAITLASTPEEKNLFNNPFYEALCV